jgi:hypothetical protein
MYHNSLSLQLCCLVINLPRPIVCLMGGQRERKGPRDCHDYPPLAYDAAPRGAAAGGMQDQEMMTYVFRYSPAIDA